MPLLRPVDRSDNCSCSNRQRITAQARIVVTKKGKRVLIKRDLGSMRMHWLAWKLVLIPLRASLEVSQKCIIKLNAKAIKVSMSFSLESCYQMDAKDKEPTRIV